MADAPETPAPNRAPLPDAWWDLSLERRRLVAGVVAIAVVLLALQGVVSVWDTLTDDEPIPRVYVARLPPARVATWDRLAECESTSRWDLDAGNGFFGGLQFTMQSWQEVGGEGSPADAPRDEQIMRAEFLYELQGWGAWPNCSAQLGLED